MVFFGDANLDLHTRIPSILHLTGDNKEYLDHIRAYGLIGISQGNGFVLAPDYSGKIVEISLTDGFDYLGIGVTQALCLGYVSAEHAQRASTLKVVVTDNLNRLTHLQDQDPSNYNAQDCITAIEQAVSNQSFASTNWGELDFPLPKSYNYIAVFVNNQWMIRPIDSFLENGELDRSRILDWILGHFPGEVANLNTGKFLKLDDDLNIKIALCDRELLYEVDLYDLDVDEHNFVLNTDLIKVYRPEVLRGAISWSLSRNEKIISHQEINNKGVGIRVNRDDDNDNAVEDGSEINVVNGENDLLEIVFINDQPWYDFDLIIKKSTTLKIWANRNKSDLIAGLGDEAVISDGAVTTRRYWIESIDELEDGELEFLLRPKKGGQDVPFYKIRLNTYQSLIIGLSGETSEFFPGSSLDQVLENGVYDICEKLYLSGYNIAYYDEDLVGNGGEGTVYNEARQQIKTCNVTKIGIFGHSHGGGSTYNLCNRLNQYRDTIGSFSIPYTAYIDAVRENSVLPENRFPASSSHLLNYYQTEGLLFGSAVPGADNHDVTHEGRGHGGIDDETFVKEAVKDRLKERIQP